ncbi:trithorax group protein osa-like isoform X2 [Homarus americanus]|uniref:trithorax group protein osa-like isoform X2 n=1 Tax=Homarus americanus TaxID=6706 RepID=UPI001C442A0B|nr:trithorax group protein osa-like isoform X2 [Homarus americanus]
MATPVPQRDDVERWTVEQVAAWLQQVELADCCDVSLRKGIDGHSLLQLTEENLVLWGRDVSIRNRKQIMKLVTQIRSQQLVSTGRHTKEMQNRECNDDDSIYLNNDAITFAKLLGSQKLLDEIQQPQNSLGLQGSWKRSPSYQQADSSRNSSEYDDEDDFDDDFGDDTEQDSSTSPKQDVSTGHVEGDEENEFYMTPRTVINTPSFPSLPTRGPPILPSRQPPTNANPYVSANRPPVTLPRGNLQNMQPPNRDVSLPGLNRGPSRANHSSINQHGGFSAPLRSQGPTDLTQRGPSPPDISGRGPAPLPGLNKNSNYPLIKPRLQQNPPSGQPSGGLTNRPPMMIPGSHTSNSPHNSRPVSPNDSGGQGRKGSFLHSTLSVSKSLEGNNATRHLVLPKPKLQQTPSQETGSGGNPNRSFMLPPPGSHNTTSPHNSRPVSPSDTGGQGGKGVYPLYHPPVSANKSLEGNNAPRPCHLQLREVQPKLNPTSQSAPYAPEKTDHEYEIVGVPVRSYTSTENNAPNSSGLLSPDITPPALPPRNQDGRDAGNRQGQGIGTQQPPVGYNISPGQVHGTAAGNSKWQVGADQGSLTKKEKWPPVPIPSHHTPSSLLRQPESSEGSRLGAGRSPTPEPLLPPSGHLSSGHPSGHAEQYPGPSHQANDCYIQFDQVPKEMAPPPPPESSPQLASRVRGATQEKIRLIGGDSIELLPLYRVLIEQPYFHVISRGKSMNILENASDGMFLIRPSTRSKDPLTLCLRHGGRTYNINIRHRSDGLFALGFEKTNEMTFSSVEDIINTHRREPIKLQNGERAMLTVSPRKSEHIYVQITNSRQMELKK